MRSDVAPPGPWLRLTAVCAAAATLLAVGSGALALDTAHRLLAALAVPPLVALVTSEGLHLGLAALAFAASLVVAAVTFRGARVPRGTLRDYVTLTKPRI